MLLEDFPVLSELNTWSILFRIILALLLGGVLGIEREQKQRPAGLRTYVVVCLGAALACITNIYMYERLGSSDPARIPAQVISGIGFLGAGTILVTRSNHIRGLTTAAGLWCAASIGIAVGTGFYSGAIICCITIVISLRLLSAVDKNFVKYNKYINLYAEYRESAFIHDLIIYTRDNDYKLQELEIYPGKGDAPGYATFTLKIKNPQLRLAVIEDLRSIAGVIFVEETA